MDAATNDATDCERVKKPWRVLVCRGEIPSADKARGVDGKYLDLHRLLLWRQLSLSWDPRREFPLQQPLYLEIGFGNGEYLARQALQRPQHNFLGIELHWGSVRRCLRRLAQERLENVRVLQVDAQVAVHYLLPDLCLEGAVALFPCPWPKRQHRRFRLFSQAFMGQLARALVPGATALVVTDHEGLRDFAVAEAPGCGLELEVVEVPAGYDTKYERRWSGLGQQVFFELHYVKKNSGSRWCRVAEVPVRSLKLMTLDPDRWELTGIHEDIVVEFRNQVFDRERRVWMVLTTVIEDHLQQTFWIEAVQQGDYWSLRPAQGGGFLPTRGVQRALDHLAQLSGSTNSIEPEVPQESTVQDYPDESP